MQCKTLPLVDFIQLLKKGESVLLDARSSKEYNKAHIPGAQSLPLLDDEHRAIIGTIYKQEGREAAVLKGFELVGPLFHEKIKKAKQLAEGRPVLIYCWRGGMRSNIMAWLLQMAGMKVTLLKDGYKTYRHWALELFESLPPIVVLGGKTGSGKTEMLAVLSRLGEDTIDLEKLANHRGSAYGHLGMPEQPTQEMFENMLAWELADKAGSKGLWLENESRSIGKVMLPNPVYDAIRNAPVVEMDVSIEVRKKRILVDYGSFPVEALIERTECLTKRLGGQHVKAAVAHLRANEFSEWLDIVLHYYDKAYQHGNNERNAESINVVPVDWQNPESDAGQLQLALATHRKKNS